MNDEKKDLDSVEQRLRRFFQKQTESLKASKDLWPKLESRLDEKPKDTDAINRKGRLGLWLAGPRLVAVSASVSVVLLLIVVGSVWLTTYHNGNNMSSTSSGGILHGPGGVFNGSTGVCPRPRLPSLRLLSRRRPLLQRHQGRGFLLRRVRRW